MKSQWTKDVFPPLVLSMDEERHYRDLARGLVWETLCHYDAYDRPGHRVLSKKRWKAVKARDNLTVYKERDPKVIEDHRLIADDWRAPKLLLGVGAVAGSLDDVMYGVVTPDAASMLLKAHLVRSTVIDGAVLAQIKGPSPAEPYRFLGIKWFVKGPPSSLRGIVWPRDLVFVESTGVLVRSNGDRVGYQLLHSVDIPGYGPLEDQSLMRGRISSCTIFRELPGGRKVDVYVRGYVEQHGRLLDSVALKAASTGFLSSWNALECGHVKKLMWLIDNPHLADWADRNTTTPNGSRTPSRRQVALLGEASGVFSLGGSNHHTVYSNHTVRRESDRDRKCRTCARKFSKVGGGGFCRLCNAAMCAKCRVAKKLHYVTYHLTLEKREAVVCRSCITHVRQSPTELVARHEVQSGRFGWRSPRSSPRAAASVLSASPSAKSPSAAVKQYYQVGESSTTRPRGSSRTSDRSSGARDDFDDPRRIVLHPSTPLGKASNEMRTGSIDTISTTLSTSSTLFRPMGGGLDSADSWGSFAEEDERLKVDEADEEDWTRTPPFTESQRRRQHLWQQMTELRLAAENTYRIAKRTTDSVMPRHEPSGRY